MAQNMMKNPAMMQQAMSMMGGGAGGDGMDMSSLAGLMGGSSGGEQPTSSRSKGAKAPFKGFDD